MVAASLLNELSCMLTTNGYFTKKKTDLISDFAV